MEREIWLEIEGRRIHCWMDGETGPAVLLLHGGGVDSARLSWRLAMPVLAKDHRVFAFDWPGYGESDAHPGVNSIQFYSDFTLQVMDMLSLQKASLAGISLGGSAALLFALDHPERVDRLVLVDPYGLQRKVAFHRFSYWVVNQPAVTRWSYAWLRRSRALTRWSLTYILSRPGSPSNEVVDEVFQEIQKEDFWLPFQSLQQSEILPDGLRNVMIDRVGELKMPTLIIHGGKDRLVPLACAEEAVRINPAIQLAVMEGCGHWPQRDWPDEFNRLISEFLK